METTQALDNQNFRSLLVSYTTILIKQLKAIPFIVQKLDVEYEKEKDAFLRFVESNNLNFPEGEENTSSVNYKVPQEKVIEYDQHYTNVDSISIFQKSVLTTQFIYSVTQFDTFLQNLMRCIYRLRPDILKSTNKQIDYKTFFGFETVNEIKTYLIEDCLDEVFRKSHKDILLHLDKLTKVNVVTDMPELYKKLIEITERRNILVHCNGIVSKQYVNVCKQNGIEVTVNEGSAITVTIEDFTSAISVLLELSVKIGFLVWKKQDNNEKTIADEFLDNVCNNLLWMNKYEIAISLIDYLAKHKDSNMSTVAKHKLKMYWIYAHKKIGNISKVNEGLNEDWTSVKPLISFILLILKEEYENAVQKMRKIGNDNIELPIELYAQSVLFSDFIKEPTFLSAYQELYNVEFLHDRKKII